MLVLPLLSLILLWLFSKECWRRSALLAAVCWALVVTVITELLSVFGVLTFKPLAIAWLLSLSLIVNRLVRSQARVKLSVTTKLPRFLAFLVGSMVVVVALIGITAVVAPPNNWDSMTYHMSRVVHWIQNRSVAHYPTSIPRQLFSGPWAGYVITHLQILSGGDRFANLVQWFSMVGSIVGVSLIAQQLGADLRGQIFAAVVCATIPMGILQGSSTQTDYVVSFWLVCFVHFALSAMQDKMSWKHVPAVGASFGLALLSKGTAYLYAFPFFLWLMLTGIKRLKWQVWKPALAIGAITLAINFGYYLRNYRVFGSVLGASEDQGNRAFNSGLLFSNLVRNIAPHLATPVRSLNLTAIAWIERLHQVLGLDASDPRTTSPPGQSFDLHSLINHEDFAGNPLHLLLILGAAVYFLMIFKQFKQREQYFLTTYLVATGAGFILFCALILWSPWRTRLHLPLFVLASAFVGVVLSKALRPIANSVAVLLVSCSLIWVLFNESRPLVFNSKFLETNRVENIFNQSRIEQYFANKPELQQPYINATQLVSQQCRRVGLLLGEDSWEYPLWVLLRQGSERVEIEHIDRESAIPAESAPCAILTDRPMAQTEIEFRAQTYTRKLSEAPVQSFISTELLSSVE